MLRDLHILGTFLYVDDEDIQNRWQVEENYVKDWYAKGYLAQGKHPCLSTKLLWVHPIPFLTEPPPVYVCHIPGEAIDAGEDGVIHDANDGVAKAEGVQEHLSQDKQDAFDETKAKAREKDGVGSPGENPEQSE